MGSPSTFVVISLLVLVGCSSSAATRVLTGLAALASAPMNSPPTAKRDGTGGGVEFISNRKYFTKDIIREPDNIYWHRNDKSHPVAQMTEGPTGDASVFSSDGQENVKKNVYFTKDLIREPDFTWWHKSAGQENEKKNVYFTKDLIREPDFTWWQKNGGQENVKNNVHFTKDLIREPDFTWWRKSGKP